MADLTYRGTDIRTSAIHFDLVRGYSERADVRGEDTVIPGNAGRTARTRVKDRRVIELRGYITGATAAAWRISTDAALALFDPSLAAGDVVLTTPYLGIAAGSKTVSARVLNVAGGPITASRFQTWSVELEAIGDPPDWA
jgi:hypothetical protein